MRLLLAALVGAAASEPITPPNPIHAASEYSRLIRTTHNGALYRVAAPDALPLDVVHVFGTASERGYAHGFLIADKLFEFLDVSIPIFARMQVASLESDLDSLPKWLADAIRKVLLEPLEKAAPTASSTRPPLTQRRVLQFNLALDWLLDTQKSYNNGTLARVDDEIDGIAAGACAAHAESISGSAQGRAHGLRPRAACDPAEVSKQLRRLNVLPDLIKMQCSILGAWGKASSQPNGSLVQMRALDFGDGPFANSSTLFVHHPIADGAVAADGALEAHPFASLAFPGFVGVITGLSPLVGLAEKVNDINGGPSSTPPGSYEGRNTAFVLRDMLEFSATKEDMHDIAAAAPRTWGVWLGVGDAASQRVEVIRYTQANAPLYDQTSLPGLIGQKAFDEVIYVDKHAQPSQKDLAMPEAISRLLGNLSATTVAQEIPRSTQSGDVHIGVYDFTPSRPAALFAIGTTSANATFKGRGARKAYAAPYVRFETDALWNEAPPKIAV